MSLKKEMDPQWEEERVKNLHKYEVLDTPPDGTFDKFTQLAAQLLEVPIAIVSLVDTDRIWFKSKYGLDAREIGRDPGLCASAILSNDFYLVEDAKSDPRTLANPLVAGEFGLRFYAAAPLTTREGYNLGTFCVIDKKPRKLSAEKEETLQNLADLVVRQMELRLEARNAVRHQHQILDITAHDLKNPLSIVPLMADMILKKKDQPEAIEDIAKQLKDAGKRMVKTITDVLDAAREEAGGVKLRLKAMDFGTLIQGVVETNLALARRKDQQLNFQIENECTVFADHQKLTEVLDNLINNAIKYTPKGKKIDVFLRKKGRKAVFVVQDEGPGLTKDDLRNLFRRYASLTAEPTGGENSTGMGLSIVKSLVDAHHGKVHAKSQGEGKGSVFMVELPLSEQ